MYIWVPEMVRIFGETVVVLIICVISSSHRIENRTEIWANVKTVPVYDFNPIRPGGGGSEARMTKLTADDQKPLTL